MIYRSSERGFEEFSGNRVVKGHRADSEKSPCPLWRSKWSILATVVGFALGVLLIFSGDHH